jgi:hypothetical protein
VKAYIDAHLSDPDLSLTAIAKNNGISLRYLHQLFRQTDMSASEWLRLRSCNDPTICSPHRGTRRNRSRKSLIRWDSTVRPISAISFVRNSACGRRTSGGRPLLQVCTESRLNERAGSRGDNFE